MTLAAFLIIQCVMLAAWWRLLALQRRLSVSERLLIAGVGYFTQIIASGIALGLLHRLTPQRHLQANLLITLAIVVFAMTRPIPARTARPLLPPLGAGGLRVVNLALLGTLMLTLVAIVRRAAIAMTPGYDALTYHLPMVVSMIKQHHLRPWATYIPIVYSYPKSVQLYMTWVLGFFGHDRWIDLSQLPFLPLAMLAV